MSEETRFRHAGNFMDTQKGPAGRDDPMHKMDEAAVLSPSASDTSGASLTGSHAAKDAPGLCSASVRDTANFSDGPITLFLRALETQDTMTRLPPFLRPLPTTMDPDAVKHLHEVGALALPGIALQNALLQAYVENVHVALPFMDLPSFLNSIHGGHEDKGQISLLLFHSVMFAATAFVDMKYLCEDGYQTRRCARKQFFQRTKLLYDFDYEQSPLIVLQALLHMTYWDEAPGEQKHTWHWMGIAVSLSYNLGIHRQEASNTSTSLEKRLRKRLWWSCFMRDRIIALDMRRLPIIEDASLNVPMLAQDDFESEWLVDRITTPLSGSSTRDARMAYDLVSMCIARAELCVLLGRVLKARFSVPDRHEVMASHARTDESANIIASELKMWAESLPGCCQYQSLSVADMRDGCATVSVQQTLLHMLYHATSWVLHCRHPTSRFEKQGQRPLLQTDERSWLIMRQVAGKVTQMITELHQFRLYRFLTSTTVTAMIPSIIINLVEMQDPSLSARLHATGGLSQCILVLEQLRDAYPQAYAVAWFVNAALKKAPLDSTLTSGYRIISVMRNELSAAVLAQDHVSRNIPSLDDIDTLPFALSTKAGPVINTPETPDVQILEFSADPPTSNFLTRPQQATFSDDTKKDVDHIHTSGMHDLQRVERVNWERNAGMNFDAELWLGLHDASAFSESSFGDGESNMGLDHLAAVIGERLPG
ncbi:Cutinase transcription factor 1 beta variant 3 [Penicillium longicatenatum]|uniref:Cutinase transcription factor 1 beta variant 3 n=1 Tax=Penicillium longicatenatum TaxID=1561947 RepID=UPI002548ED8D|nr:Cutinase transcription factor 1 beta variant 3 [Penicillium longicatenatum]KAJ5657116.1 Cutinase transcription factor 1 beta variant 3 [Penicillium longicatenatum]